MSFEQWRTPQFTQPESTQPLEPMRADPEIDAMIAEYVEEYGLSIANGEKASFKLKDEGGQIDDACLGLTRRGNKEDWDKSARLRALRAVRKISRPLFCNEEQPIEYTYPLLKLGLDKEDEENGIYFDPHYWAKVDNHVMEYLQLQAKNQDGDYYGYPDVSELAPGRNDYLLVATMRDHNIFKSTVVAGDFPVHVSYTVAKNS